MNGTNDKSTGTKGGSIDKCTNNKDIVGNHVRRTGSAHGYQRGNRDNEVLPMRKARSLQERLPHKPKTREEHLCRVNTYWDKHPTVEVMATVKEVKEDAEK